MSTYNCRGAINGIIVQNNPVNFIDPDGLILDTIADAGFILYDLYKVATDPCNREEHLKALGLDVGGLFIPFATGLGATYKVGKRVKKLSAVPGAGPHTVFKRSPNTGKISGYTEFDAAGNPVKRFRGEGGPHGGVNPPFILDPKPGKGPGSRPIVPRTPRPDELPLGY